MKALRNLRTIGLLLLVVVGIGTAGFHYIEGWSWFDGFYMVVTTLTTIGYQEVHPLSHTGRIFNVFVIFVGCFAAVVGGRGAQPGFARIRAAELLRKAAHGARHRQGSRTTTLSAAWDAWDAAWHASWRANQYPFVIIENAEDKRQTFVAENWLVLAGDATQEADPARSADRAGKWLIAATTTDATNLYIVLTARGLNP